MMKTSEVKKEMLKAFKKEFKKIKIETTLNSHFENVFNTYINVNEKDLEFSTDIITRFIKGNNSNFAQTGYFTDEFNEKIRTLNNEFQQITKNEYTTDSIDWLPYDGGRPCFINQFILILPNGEILRR